MDKIDIVDTLQECKSKLEEVYDIWHSMPHAVTNEFEDLFVNNQGAGFHIYRAMENIDDIDDRDIDEIYKKCNCEMFTV